MPADNSDTTAGAAEAGTLGCSVSRRSVMAAAVASATVLAEGIRSASAAAARREPGQLAENGGIPGLEFVFQATVTIAPVINFGQGSYGLRRIIPITGGRFRGPGLSGEVLDEGQDTQLVRPDGVTEICARYALRADDGELIYIVNRGLIVPGASPAAKPSYMRTHPTFEAAVGGRYEWLNKSLFIGTLHPLPVAQHGVVIRVFRVT